MMCSLATEHAGQATTVAEQSRVLLAQAANEIARLEAENHRYKHQVIKSFNTLILLQKTSIL